MLLSGTSSEKYSCFVIFYLAIIKCALADEAATVDPSKYVSLTLCHCNANQVWDINECVTVPNTSVDVLLEFYPEMLLKKIALSEINNITVRNLVCASTETVFHIDHVVPLKDGDQLFQLYSGKLFKDYCIDHVLDPKGNIVAEAKICLPTAEIPWCCSDSEIFDDVVLACDERSQDFDLPIKLGFKYIPHLTTKNVLRILPECEKTEYRRHLLSNNGIQQTYLNYELPDHAENNNYGSATLHLFSENDEDEGRMPDEILYHDQYCVTQFRYLSNSTQVKYVAYSWNHTLCESVKWLERNKLCERKMYWIQLPLLLLSTFFLFMILVLHVALAECRITVGSKITMCHVGSLLALFAVLLALYIPQNFNCKIYGPLIQVTTLAAFFWLNVMCFDFWWKVRSGNPAGESLDSSRKRFLHYSLYAWGLPLVIGITSIVIDTIPQLRQVSWLIRPGFGEPSCWFSDFYSGLIYYFGIIGILMTANFLFFVWVLIILVKANCTYNKVLKNNYKSHTGTYVVYFKIFCMMGVTWLGEILSWLHGACIAWIITDVINAVRGIVLFFIFFGNEKSLKKVRKKCTSMNETLHTHVSHSMDSLRKLSLKPSSASSETGLESRRTSETITELSNRNQPAATKEH